LVISEGKNLGTELILEQQDHRYVLGRSAIADLVLLETNASRRHVEVWRQGASVMLRELGSKNGSQLDSSYILPDKEMVWPDGAVLGIGAERIVLLDPTQEALKEMSRAADDHLSAAEQDELASAPAAVTETNVLDQPTIRARSGVSSQGRPSAAKPKRGPSGRVTSADLSVVILALAVLGASLLVLLWMLGGK
jgi:pSer/pThr/pTyr-binding forkhead associated (FHA) protein